MLKFEPIKMEDKTWMTQLLAMEPTMGCEYDFVTNYLWGHVFCRRIARCGDRLVMRVMEGSEVCYVYPAGSGPLEPVLAEMEADAKANGAPLRIICVPETFKNKLEEAFPGRFRVEADRDSFDYIYSIDKLADLKGKKMHAKRNHINRFNENYPDWMFEPMNESNREECRAMAEEWLSRRWGKTTELEKQRLTEERTAIFKALDQMNELGLDCGAIRAGGRVVAFAIGSRLSTDGYDIHFEKAFDDIQGAYSAINREMARYVRTRYPGVKWINREDDVGVEGLRKAKLSYYPDLLLEKFTVAQA